MSFAEFVVWLASSAALGAVSSLAFQLLKRAFPTLQDMYAKIGSVIFAAVLSVAAQYAVPLLPELPAWVEQLWPIVVWIWSQIAYETKVKRALPA